PTVGPCPDRRSGAPPRPTSLPRGCSRTGPVRCERGPPAPAGSIVDLARTISAPFPVLVRSAPCCRAGVVRGVVRASAGVNQKMRTVVKTSTRDRKSGQYRLTKERRARAGQGVRHSRGGLEGAGRR